MASCLSGVVLFARAARGAKSIGLADASRLEWGECRPLVNRLELAGIVSILPEMGVL